VARFVLLDACHSGGFSADGSALTSNADLSPLLSNIYVRRFLPGWKVLGHAARRDAHIVNYADDLTILCRGTAIEAMNAMRDIIRLKLTVNARKPDSQCSGILVRLLRVHLADAIR
jgi:hypothetical protein